MDFFFCEDKHLFLYFDFEELKIKIKNPKVQKSKGCENVKSNNRIIQ